MLTCRNTPELPLRSLSHCLVRWAKNENAPHRANLAERLVGTVEKIYFGPVGDFGAVEPGVAGLAGVPGAAVAPGAVVGAPFEELLS